MIQCTVLYLKLFLCSQSNRTPATSIQWTKELTLPFVQVLAASQSPIQKKWFQGTADAVRQYLWLFENSMREGVEDFLILAGAQQSLLMTLLCTGYGLIAC